MPKVSIILPTFNRADTILRAVKSAQAQTFQNWELIVIDDGSTDNTAALLHGIDPRLTLIRQANRGMTEARNAGIRAASGDYCAFLDSDDEFLPHHLELCVAFLDEFKEAQSVSTELLEDFGHGRVINHYRIETSEWYPRKAALIGSHRLDLPAGVTDNYLRVYESREPIGEWGRQIVERLRPAETPHVYRGMIFEHMRYDYLIAITASVIRTSVFKDMGMPEARWRTGSDYHFLACLCRNWQAHFISIPTFVKHEYAEGGALPLLGHIVTGKSALAFITDWQNAWEDLYWNARNQDQELRGLRGLRMFWMAQAALNAGQRELTLHYLEQAMSGLPRFGSATALYWLIRCVPGVKLPRKIYDAFGKISRRAQRLLGA